jgi:putative multiple sugar transport system substrate-binding protein
MGTDAVTYYATFDNWAVGVMQGEYIEEHLGLKTNSGPFNIEFFTGDEGDNNINFFYDGALSILQKYLDSGVLVCPSGQVAKKDVATPNWSATNAESRMKNLISSNNYSPTGTKLDAVLCSNDSTATGVVNALKAAGYTKDSAPIVTGQDADIASVENIIAGMQSMSVFKDTRTLAGKVAQMVTSILKGEDPDINDRETYDNNTGIVPTYMIPPIVVTVDNYEASLFDIGYYVWDADGNIKYNS